MPAKKPKEEPAIVADVLLADGSKARLSAVQTAKAKATAQNCAQPAWRGICAICLDPLPVKAGGQRFFDCCCQRICIPCSHKCDEYDTRCPLCRANAPTSHAEVVRWLQKHVDSGLAVAQLQLGDMYRAGGHELRKSPKRAFHLYQLAAAQGDAEAQNALGRCYDYGEGVQNNYPTAVMWYKRAAEQSMPIAQYNLGLLFHDGNGVAQSYFESAKWWRLAAAQGNADALYGLGLCHVRGLGVPQDLDEAVRLLKRAKVHGSADAAAAVAAVEALGV